MQETFENEQTQTIRESLVAWLGRENWKPQELIDWLQSYGLPISSEDDAFLWLLRALPPDELYPAKKKLASRTAAVLALNPDETRPGDDPDKVLFNLFYLCAGLACADELADPLYDVYRRRKLEGEWAGIDLRDALRAALTTNQIDARLESVWHGMLDGSGDGYLPGDSEDGFEGLAFMRRSRDEPGEPAWDAIACALNVVTQAANNDANRRIDLRESMSRLLSIYPGEGGEEFIRIADQYDWPRWAVETIPSLVIPLGTETDSVRALVWRYIVDSIPHGLPYQVCELLCQEQVVDIELSGRARDFVDAIAPIFEKNRFANPFLSERASWGMIIASIIESGIDVRLSPIAKELSRVVGGYGQQEFLELIEPAVAALREAETGNKDLKDELKQIASDCEFPKWAVTCLEKMELAA